MGEYSESSMTFYGRNIHYYSCDTVSIESVYAPSHGLSGKSLIKNMLPHKEAVSHIGAEAINSALSMSRIFGGFAPDTHQLKNRTLRYGFLVGANVHTAFFRQIK